MADMSFIGAITPLFTDELRAPKYRGNPNPLAGHCYVMAEVLYVLLGRDGLKPMFVRHEGEPHWYLYDFWTKQPIDPTASQFSTPVPYDQARGKGFLTKAPSKRAQIVLRRFYNPHAED